jgi:hypothetical protein
MELDKNMIMFLVLVVAVIIFMKFVKTKEGFDDDIESTDLICTKKTCKDKMISNFDNKELLNYYELLVDKYGYPSYMNDKPSGHVIWKKIGFIDKLILQDKLTNYLTISVKLYVPKYLIKDVLSICVSLSYNKSKHELSVKGESINRNIAVLYSVMQFLNNPTEMNLVDTKNNLNKVIVKTRKDWNYQVIYNELKNLLKNHYIRHSNMFNKKKYEGL